MTHAIKQIYLSAALLFFAASGAQAIEYALPGGIHGPEKGPGGFVDNFYRFSLLAAGVLAFAAIVFGGIKYTLAAGNPSGQSEGKEWVKGALLGLLLLGGAALILRTINPELASLRLPGLPGLAPASSQTSAPTPAPASAANYGCKDSSGVVFCTSDPTCSNFSATLCSPAWGGCKAYDPKCCGLANC